jgi:hypothetical protein
MAAESFSPVVAARPRTARSILDTPALLAIYQEVGGLPSDLDAIVVAGTHAEAGALGQSQSKGAQQAATLDVNKSFIEVQREYVAVMSVVQAVLKDVAGDAATVAALKQILVNEAPVVITTTASGAKKSRKSTSHEALRAEIDRDASALLALQPAAAALAARKVDAARLTKLQADAHALSGKLAVSTTQKGAKKAATQATYQAVAEQKLAWQAAYRLLHLVGVRDARVAALLKESADRR